MWVIDPTKTPARLTKIYSVKGVERSSIECIYRITGNTLQIVHNDLAEDEPPTSIHINYLNKRGPIMAWYEREEEKKKD